MPLRGVRGGQKLDRLIKEAGRRGPRAVRFGYIDDAAYDDGTRIADVAAINEFGAPERGIPERPAFRRALQQMLPDLRRELRRGFDARKGYVDRPTVERIGKVAQGQVKASILNLLLPANAPATLERKTGANPLVDSGKMIDAVRSEVVD